jgi:drug/metabolite transporter (DMT)-like permease
VLDTAASSRTTTRWLPYAVLSGAVVVLSTGAVFVRMAQSEHVPSLVIAALRYAFAVSILTPLLLTRHRAELRQTSWADRRRIMIAGVAFALSLVSFFLALENATVLIANLFTNTHPLWVGLLEMLLLGTLLSRRVWFGIVLALGGAALFAVSGSLGEMGPNPMVGVLLALGAAFLSTAYFILGRTVRVRVSTVVFMWIIMLTGVITLSIALLLTHTTLTGYSTTGYLWILLVAFTGQVVGQGLLSFSLAHLPATFVSVSMLVQVVLSAFWAFIAFQENPGFIQIIASGVILAGVGLVITARTPRTSNPG